MNAHARRARAESGSPSTRWTYAASYASDAASAVSRPASRRARANIARALSASPERATTAAATVRRKIGA